jgi:hypothetical protein
LSQWFGDVPDDPIELGCVDAEQRSAYPSKKGARREAQEDPHVQRHTSARALTIVGLLVEIRDDVPFKRFHSTGRRNNMSPTHE